MKLILLRHAESVSNKIKSADSRMNSELTKEGKEEAKRLMSRLKKYKIDVFIVSPLKRTLDTIAPFLNTLKAKPKVVISELTSERDLGDFTGSKMGDFQRYCEENQLNKIATRPKNGESILDTYKRAEKFLSFFEKEI
ncbi:MAG: histidine phosphatase family protein [Candidatus Pacearchaeota archaeon]|nr:histidine phosphatase family protein [Candidatus Pacearchaeota archaeon]